MAGFGPLFARSRTAVDPIAPLKLGLVWVNQSTPHLKGDEQSVILDGLPELVCPEQTIMEDSVLELFASQIVLRIATGHCESTSSAGQPERNRGAQSYRPNLCALYE
jgi:hypothetical protein